MRWAAAIILDLVIIGDPSSVTKCEVLGNFGTSDHNIILTKLSCPLPRIDYAPRKIYLYSKGDYSALNEEIETIDWDSTMTSGDIEENWLFFIHQYQILLDKHVPFKFVKPGRRHVPPWTRYKSVAKAKTKRRASQIQARKGKLAADKIIYESDEKSVENSLKSAKAHYEEKLSHQVGKIPKRFWNYTRHFSRSSQTVDTLESGTSQVTIDSEKAEILNEHFAESQTVEDFDLPYCDPQTTTTFLLSDIEVSSFQVKNIMLHLKPNKANGPDNISTNILKFVQPLQPPCVPCIINPYRLGPCLRIGRMLISHHFSKKVNGH